MNREQELSKLFNAYKEMTTTLNKLSNVYVNEDSLSLEDQLLYEAMFRELGWDNKEDFLNGVGNEKVITINVPIEHKYGITLEFTNVHWLLNWAEQVLMKEIDIDFDKNREWVFEEVKEEEE